MGQASWCTMGRLGAAPPTASLALRWLLGAWLPYSVQALSFRAAGRDRPLSCGCVKIWWEWLSPNSAHLRMGPDPWPAQAAPGISPGVRLSFSVSWSTCAGSCPRSQASSSSTHRFRGPCADFYPEYAFLQAVIAAVADAFKLTGDDVVVDLGCGTGPLALPIARRVRAVISVDPEHDMLARARRAAREQGIANVSWMIGADTDIPALRALFGSQRAGAVTIAQALHWMNHDELFQAAIRLLRPGGGIAVITNGTPLWLHDTAWSRALRSFLDQWLGTTATATCGTDAASQRRYRDSLTAAGYEVDRSQRPLQRRSRPGRRWSAASTRRCRPASCPRRTSGPEFAEQIPPRCSRTSR